MAPTVLITGASQGIGRATALLFARNGYNLVLAARQPDRLEAFVQELKSLSYSAIAIPTDVRDPQQVKNLVQQGLAEYGSIEVLINNAGIYASGPVDSFSLEDWHQTIDTNLWGYIHTIHELLPHFIERKSGTIVNLSSIGGKVPVPYLVAYNTSKYAVTGLTQSLQSELAPKGISVCGIYPNLIRSDLMERAIFRGKTEDDVAARRQQLEQVLSVPVVEKPDDVAKAIWDAVKHKRAETIVGSANLSIASNRLFPDLMQWVFRRTFKNKDQDYGTSIEG
ncbi:SDR family NAD(P)-dependent oxidoreductase [Phormidesmis priestleyi ULC007]|uniref:SDR family NAD(P)-dependent oxidoreductase n=1 Tax=Phormidesmis priestleyi ULC007 TaxID=1920490 RepID=A0A2T1D6Q1_9CYAN|nr:SDR family oxidoreductase [Phormidesmis priestleyi]PSB16193.1 SDR family NAD(P)-dependent oxidoreductase [Phormidesmis priestleyi ULC007]PZO46932.1 MAG: SDR family NAD(P)-dependent oxidoreductase [Phormidesmis priestleyi]